MNGNEIKFGRNIQVLRSQSGMSQQDLADIIHVTRQTVSLWERGQGKPDIYYLHDICKLFGISTDRMLYDTVIMEHEYEGDFSASSGVKWELPETDEIRSIDKKGFYTFLDDDLYNFMDLIEISIVEIMVIGTELKEKGYIITEIFDNGFSVVFITNEQAKRFQYDLYDIIETFIHGDNDNIQRKRSYYAEMRDSVNYNIVTEASREIFGKAPTEFNYLWMDMMENPRGYADSEEECARQAKEQGCEKYKILPCI